MTHDKIGQIVLFVVGAICYLVLSFYAENLAAAYGEVLYPVVAGGLGFTQLVMVWLYFAMPRTR